MAIDTQTHNITQIHAGSQSIAEAHIWTGTEWKKVWPDAPTEQFTIVHTKRTGFTITVGCSTYNLVTINWGDGTSTIVNSSTAKTHNYTTSGTYTVTITGDITKITSLYCNSQLVSSIALTADCLNIADFQCYSNNLTVLDVQYLTQLTTFYCYSNASLASLTMPTTVINNATRNYRLYSTAIPTYNNPIGATAFSFLALHLCSNLTSVDVSNITSSTYFYAYSCANLTSIDASNLASCKQFHAYSCANLTSIDASNLASCDDFSVYSCASLTSINVSNLSTCTYFYAYSCASLNPPSLVFSYIYAIRLNDCLFTDNEVDSILNNCLSLNISGGRIYLAGNNAAPSASGNATKAALLARSWQVNTN